MSRTLRLFALLLACAWTIPWIDDARAADGASNDAAVLIALSVGRYRLSDGVDGLDDGGRPCLDFAQFVAALDFPIDFDAAGHRATGWYIREDNATDIDFLKQTAIVRGKAAPWPVDGVRATPEGYCVGVAALETWFQLSMKYERNGAIIDIGSTEGLPVIERIARKQRGQLSLNKPATDTALAGPAPQQSDYKWFGAPALDVLANYRSSHDKDGKSANQVFGSVLAVGELARATAEAFVEGDSERGAPHVSRFRLYRRAPDGGVFGVKALTEAAIGDVTGSGSALGASGGVGTGVSVSTFPTTRADLFDRTTLVGDIPSGWDAELYRNDQLLEVRSDVTGGRYDFEDVAVLLGDNDFEVRLLGPHGEVRSVRRHLSTNDLVAPKGRAYARLAAYQPGRLLFAGTSGAPGSSLDATRVEGEWRYGAGANLSVGATVDSYLAGDRRALITGLSARTTVLGASAGLGLAHSDTGGLASEMLVQRRVKSGGARVRYVWASPAYASERFASGVKARLETGLDTSARLSGHGVASLSTSANVDTYRNGQNVYLLREQGAFSTHGQYVSQSLTWRQGVAGEETLEGNVLYSAANRKGAVRAGLDFSLAPEARATRVSLAVDRRLDSRDRGWRWGGEANWNPQTRKSAVSLGASRGFKCFDLNVSGQYDSDNAFSAGVNMSFSLGRGTAGWRATAHELARTGVVQARVFEDIDGDGRFSEGDAALRGVAVRATASAGPGATDARGLAIVDNVDVLAPEVLAIDTDALDTPYVVTRAAHVMAREGTIVRADIPLSRAGSVEGVVTAVRGEREPQPIGGIEVQLRDSSGAVRATTVSAYDGFYIFENVPLDAYTLVARPAGARAANLVQPVTRSVIVSRGELFVSDVGIVLAERSPTVGLAAAGGSMR